MRKFLMILMVAVMAAAVGVGCKKKEEPAPPVTSLKVKVVDTTGAAVEGAGVFLYDNEADFEAFENHKGTAQTNAAGEATFSNLESRVYWFDVITPDLRSNEETTVRTSNAIPAGQQTSITVEVK